MSVRIELTNDMVANLSSTEQTRMRVAAGAGRLGKSLTTDDALRREYLNRSRIGRFTQDGGIVDSLRAGVNLTSALRNLPDPTSYAHSIDYHEFTPAWDTAANPQPSLGNGTLFASYLLTQGLCFYALKLIYGSTSTGGTGTWRFSLPRNIAGDKVMVGSAHMEDSGATFYLGTAVTIVPGSSTADVVRVLSTSSGYVNSTVPFTWATGDLLLITLLYPYQIVQPYPI